MLDSLWSFRSQPNVAASESPLLTTRQKRDPLSFSLLPSKNASSIQFCSAGSVSFTAVPPAAQRDPPEKPEGRGFPSALSPHREHVHASDI